MLSNLWEAREDTSDRVLCGGMFFLFFFAHHLFEKKGKKSVGDVFLSERERRKRRKRREQLDLVGSDHLSPAEWEPALASCLFATKGQGWEDGSPPPPPVDYRFQNKMTLDQCSFFFFFKKKGGGLFL